MSVREVFPNMRLTIDCRNVCKQAECKAHGAPKGKLGHVRGCVCKSCTNGQSSRLGKRSQVSTARIFGDKRVSSLHPGNEETMRTFLRMEKKSGGIAKPPHTFFDKLREQSNAAKSLGDNRPFIAAAEHEGRTLLIIDQTDWDEAQWLTGAEHGWGPGA